MADSSWKLCWPVRWSNTPPSWSRSPYSRASARPALRPRPINQSTRSLPQNRHSKWVCCWQGGRENRSCWGRQWPWCDCGWLNWTWVEMGGWCSISDRRQAAVWGLWRNPCTSGLICSRGSGSVCRCRGPSHCPPPPLLLLSEEGFTWRNAHALPWATAS